MLIKTFENFTQKNSKIGQKLDYYYLLEDMSTTRLRDLFKVVEYNNFRAIATFSSQIESISELPCKKIALINYPSENISQNKLFLDITKTTADEVEFPWKKSYLKLNGWRDLVLTCLSQGKIIRPMLELGVESREYLTECINFFKEIGIKDICTSTGLIEKYITPGRLEELKSFIPPIFKIKVIANIKDLDTANAFFKAGSNLIATSKTSINID